MTIREAVAVLEHALKPFIGADGWPTESETAWILRQSKWTLEAEIFRGDNPFYRGNLVEPHRGTTITELEEIVEHKLGGAQ